MHESGKENCPKCGGKGHIRVDPPEDTHNPFPDYERCVCLIESKFRQEVGEDIYNAEQLDESPFLELADEDTYIKGTRKKLLPHLRYVLQEKGFNFFFRDVTDQNLVDAWLGKSERTDVPDQNVSEGFKSLADAVEPPDLLIIRIGNKRLPNKELPNVIFESVVMRRDNADPTWILNSPDQPFADGGPNSEGHPCYSNQLNEYFEDHFTFKDIGSHVSEADTPDQPSNGANGEDKAASANQDIASRI